LDVLTTDDEHGEIFSGGVLMSCRSRFPKGFPLLLSTVILLSLVISSLFTGCGGGLKAGVVASKSNAVSAGVFLPSSKPFGKSYPEWAAAWVQWFYSIPASIHPGINANKDSCGVGQSGPVWFLTFVFGITHADDRTCTIPADKAILISGSFFVDVIPEDATTEDGLPAAANGNFVMLEPLPVGQHTLTDHFTLSLPQGPNIGMIERTVTYHLTIVPVGEKSSSAFDGKQPRRKRISRPTVPSRFLFVDR
jgi:hypothetical protein